MCVCACVLVRWSQGHPATSHSQGGTREKAFPWSTRQWPGAPQLVATAARTSRAVSRCEDSIKEGKQTDVATFLAQEDVAWCTPQASDAFQRLVAAAIDPRPKIRKAAHGFVLVLVSKVTLPRRHVVEQVSKVALWHQATLWLGRVAAGEPGHAAALAAAWSSTYPSLDCAAAPLPPPQPPPPRSPPPRAVLALQGDPVVYTMTRPR